MTRLGGNLCPARSLLRVGFFVAGIRLGRFVFPSTQGGRCNVQDALAAARNIVTLGVRVAELDALHWGVVSQHHGCEHHGCEHHRGVVCICSVLS